MKIYECTDYDLNFHDASLIRVQMKNLLSSIADLEGRINVRDLVVGTLYKNEGKRPQEVIEELHTILDDATEALRELEKVRESLSILGEELLECRAVML